MKVCSGSLKIRPPYFAGTRTSDGAEVEMFVEIRLRIPLISWVIDVSQNSWYVSVKLILSNAYWFASLFQWY